MSNKPTIELKNITMQFSENLVLDKVNMALCYGKIHCLMGYNGSGKSILTRVVAGEHQATEGEIYYNGVRQKSWDSVRTVSHGVVLISGFSNLFVRETVLENMQYSLVRSGSKPFSIIRNQRHLMNAIETYLKKYGIRCTLNTPVYELSNGDRVLLEFLRAQLMGAKILLLDEIDTVLGRRYKKIMLELVQEWKGKQAAILYISHKLDMVQAIADQISILQYGRITHTFLREGFKTDELIEMMFGSSKECPPRLHKNRGEQLLEIRDFDIQENNLSLYEGEILGVVSIKHGREGGIYDLLYGSDVKNKEVRIRSRKVDGMRIDNSLQYGVVVMSSVLMQHSIFPGYSVQKNMLPYNIIRRLRRKQLKYEICQRYIDVLNIKTTPTADFDTLSMGRQRKVFIARSILSKGDIYVFDNPTDSIDSISKIDIYNIINELKNRGKGIIFLSDDVKEVLGVSDRIITLHGSRISGCYHVNGMDDTLLGKILHLAEQSL